MQKTNEAFAGDRWMHLKTDLFKVTEEISSIFKKSEWHKQTWWWDNSVNDAVDEKRRLFKIWKKKGSKEEYISAKKVAK